jgi:hypothetical protein
MIGRQHDRNSAAAGMGSAASARRGLKTGEGKPLTGGPKWHSVGRRHQIQFEIEFQMNSISFKL